ncbi:MAG: IS30 family transposase [Opitutales bacterium]
MKVLREFDGFFTKNLSIQTCPDLSSRAGFGHWEWDTFELVRGQNYLVTLVKRKTRFLATKLIPNKKPETIRNAISSAFEPFPQAVKSITLDNGTEFADHKTIASPLNAMMYFAHPHCPWKCGIGSKKLSNGQRPLTPSRPHLAIFF